MSHVRISLSSLALDYVNVMVQDLKKVLHSGSWSVVCHLEFKMIIIFHPGYG